MMQNRKARMRWQDEMSLWPALQWVFHIKVYTAMNRESSEINDHSHP